ncbi:MAG: hypothetical protein JST89_14390 [Cyanobacteria bacterium SZAS-4]|nr:hypothetical protein [Cyanobacteria bacterium SZAS-4]
MRAFKIKIETFLLDSKFLVRAMSIVFGLLLSASCFFYCAAIAQDNAASAPGNTAPMQENTAPEQENTSPVSISAATVPDESESGSPYAAFVSNLHPEMSKGDLRRRPLLYFRMWANKPLPLVPSFLFLFFITVVASEIMPARMYVARNYYVSHYWRSLWSGIVACLLFVTLARALFASEIGVPLAVVSLAALEFFVLIGASISTTLIGQNILSALSPKRPPAPDTKRHWAKRLAAPLVGSLLLSLLLIIPPLGILPRVGIRLIMLLSFLGMGAFFRTGMGTKEMGGSSD